MTSERLDRLAARVLLINAAGEVLLLHGFDPADRDRGSWWFTPGGGLDPGEDPRAGAVRELFEETGLKLAPDELAGPVHERIAEFTFGNAEYRQSEVFYVARIETWTVDTSGFTAVEQECVDGHRWWSRAELAATTERVYPEALPALLGSALSAEGV
jgi:8-oxo-dGTP pyrophosphatase MutT (NUDIX family)